MSEQDERITKVEERLAALERIVADARAKFDAFAAGPGRKILRALGITP